MSQPESYSRLPKKLAVYTYGEQNPVVMKDPDGLDDIYYDQKGYEIERKETTKWYNPATWGDNKFVQGNKSDQWWPTTEDITPGSINGVEDTNVAETMDKFVDKQASAQANTFMSSPKETMKEVLAKSPQKKDWDYKRNLDPKKLYVLDGKAYKHDYVGNVAWGSIMKRKDVPEFISKSGAGLYQIKQDLSGGKVMDSIGKIIQGNGDDPRDTQAIGHGYAR